jgi:hypothetical protein
MLDRDRLAKILGLLGSGESGEILSAGRAADALIRNANTSWAEVLNQRALLAENAKLRAMAYRLEVENTALRKQAARRLPHRIVEGAKQYGQALLGAATAVDGSKFPGRQLAARHRDGEPRRLRPVVVRSLLVAGILATPGIFAFYSLHDVAMVVEPSVRSGSAASSGQEAPAATARSGGPPTQPDRRATISGPPPIAGEAPPPTALPAAEIAALVTRGDDFLSAGDIVSGAPVLRARGRSRRGGVALRLGATFDLGFLARTGVRGALGDPVQASSWYRRAADLGNPAAQERLQNLEQPRVPEPDPLLLLQRH